MRLMRRHQTCTDWYTRLSIDEAALATLLKNTHLRHGERKLHVLLIAFGSECSRERKYQGAKVPPMVLSLLGAKVRGNESSSYPYDYRFFFSLNVFSTVKPLTLALTFMSLTPSLLWTPLRASVWKYSIESRLNCTVFVAATTSMVVPIEKLKSYTVVLWRKRIGCCRRQVWPLQRSDAEEDQPLNAWIRHAINGCCEWRVVYVTANISCSGKNWPA